MSLSAGTLLRQYEIAEPIGAGSMGEVYRALDTRLGRHVAIKILPERLAEDPEMRDRFEREARAIAALSHPAILSIHEFTRTGDTLFAVMELLQGESLRSRLTKGSLRWREAVEIAATLADGLAAAHAKDVIHRDLKPENIFLTADHGPKILDFGLARHSAVPPAFREAASSTIVAGSSGAVTFAGTLPGVVLGTIGYMAPEQIQGRPADARSDLFALGCVLHEMLTGERPFHGSNPQEIMASTLRDQAPRLPPLDPPAPPELARIIDHCLAKAPERRFGSARDVAFALRATLVGSGAVPAPGRRRPARSKSIAVLPFQNLGSGEDLEYLSDGITESIINSLSQLPGLRVVPRGSVFRYKGTQVDMGAVGLALNVRSLLTGRVTQRGNLLNVQAELVDTASESQLWGEQYRRPLAEMQTVQEEIAWHISEALRIKLTGEQKKRIAPPKTASPDAYQEYLRALHHWNRWTPEGFRAAAEHCERAIALDPSYALAWSGLGDAYGALAWYQLVDPDEGWAKARAAALRAVQLDDHLPEAHNTLALVHYFYAWNWTEADREFRRAIEIRPSFAMARSWYGLLLTTLGRTDAGVDEARRAVELDPLSLLMNLNLGWVCYQARRYDEALRQARQIMDLDRGFHEAQALAAAVSERRGNFTEAARSITGALQHLGVAVPPVRTDSADAYWRSRLAMLEAIPHARLKMPEMFIASYLGLGDTGAALDLMEHLVAVQAGHCVFFKSDPVFDPLRGNPRYERIIERVFRDTE